MRLAALMRAPTSLVVLASCSFLSLVTSNALADLPVATYSGVLTVGAFPTGNPGCNTPPVTCVNQQFLTAPGTLTVTSPSGAVPDQAQLTFRASGPSISASASSFPITGGIDHAVSRATGAITYYVEIVGPAGMVPVHVAAVGGVSALNGFSSENSAGVAMYITQPGIPDDGNPVACANDPDFISPDPACNQLSFSGTYSLSFAANTPITVGLSALASVASPYVGTYNANIDPIFTVDPAFPNAGSYTILVSPAITQGTGSVVPPPVFASAVSRKVHGSAGTFDLPLSTIPTNPTTEPRAGPAQAIVFTFDKAITAANAAVTEGTATAGTPTFSGNDVIVGLTGVNDQQYVTVSLTNVASSDGGSGGVASARIGFLRGDVNGNRVVTVADLGLVNAQLAQFVTQANFLKDVNASGTLTVADKGITNANLTRNLPAP